LGQQEKAIFAFHPTRQSASTISWVSEYFTLEFEGTKMSDSLSYYESQTKAWEEECGDVLVKMSLFKLRFENDNELEDTDMFRSLRSLLCTLFLCEACFFVFWSFLTAWFGVDREGHYVGEMFSHFKQISSTKGAFFNRL
jgi:hypothetical protein